MQTFQWLLTRFDEALAEQEVTENSIAASANSLVPRLSLRQVALLYVYTGRVIPPSADAIAQQYGYESGRTLYKRYLMVAQRAGRIGENVQGKVLQPMLADITAVIPYLTGSHRQQAENEQQTLEARK